MKKKILTVLIVVLILVSMFLIPYSVNLYKYYFVTGKDPVETIKENLDIELPSSTETINYEYEKKSAYFSAKIKLQPDSVDDMRDQLVEKFGTNNEKQYSYDNFMDFEYVKTQDWWDLKIEEAKYCYFMLDTTNYYKFKRSGAKTVYLWMFISETDTEEYYLYIDRGVENKKSSDNPRRND